MYPANGTVSLPSPNTVARPDDRIETTPGTFQIANLNMAQATLSSSFAGTQSIITAFQPTAVDEGFNLEQQVTPQPEIVSAWKLNTAQPGITAERDLAPGTEIDVTVTQPDGSKRPLPVFKVTRGSQYLWPADMAQFINQQANLLNLPIAAGERLHADELSFPASYYRNMLWVPANGDYTVQYRVKP